MSGIRSSIEVLNAPPDEWLTTVDTVMRALDLEEDTDIQDLEGLIRAASDWIKQYCGRTFARQRVIEHLVGSGLPDMLLTLTPIIDVEQIEFGDTNNGLTILSADEWEIFDPETGVIQRFHGWIPSHFRWKGDFTMHPNTSPYGKKMWHVTYTAGYVLPNWHLSGIDRDLPYDLERACISLLRSLQLNAKIDGGWSTYKIGDTMVQWGRGSQMKVEDPSTAGLPSSVLSILNFHRRSF